MGFNSGFKGLMVLLEFPSPAASGANTTDIENGDFIAER